MRPTLAALLMTLACASPVTAGSIRGSVRVPSAPAAEAGFRPYAGRASSLPAPVRTVRGAVTDAVIYLDAAPADSTRHASDERPQLGQRGQAFEPRVVVVPVGGTVDFPNFDPIFHNVFSVSPARRFDLGKYPRGTSRSVRFPRAGVVNVYCDIHSDMSAFIVVVPNTAWTRPDRDGAYAIDGLPAGRYQLRWWHPDFGAGSAWIEVPSEGAATRDVGF